ncbi:MAG: Co2+/Mg2+ efflux protein ApaG [Leptospirales bacterium]|nr:Co2+/Mg2+ efflux protein ApaG [Leptospirales bacterium]
MHQISKDIRVRAVARYIPERSNPLEPLYFFAYNITITNEGDTNARLRSRYWHITDAAGRVQEVRGAGVVGEYPYLKPGESYNYTSFCPLPTNYGFMKGHYVMETDEGETFEADIPAFALVIPDSAN